MVSALEFELVCFRQHLKLHMIASGLHSRQLFYIDTAGILMKEKTGLNHFTISVDKYGDGEVLKIYLDHKFEWPQWVLNCESFAYEVVT